MADSVQWLSQSDYSICISVQLELYCTKYGYGNPAGQQLCKDPVTYLFLLPVLQ